MKRIECGSLVPGCTFKAQAATDADALSMELRHVKEAHQIAVTPAFLERARARIENVEDELTESSIRSRRAASHG